MATDTRKVPGDSTPIVGATDIAPLGGPKPPHERTADEEAGAIDWERLAASDRFRNLLKAKRRFIVPAMIFFIVYYFALPVLVRLRAAVHGETGARAGESRLSLRAFAVFHGVDHRRALCGAPRPGSTRWPRTLLPNMTTIPVS